MKNKNNQELKILIKNNRYIKYENENYKFISKGKKIRKFTNINKMKRTIKQKLISKKRIYLYFIILIILIFVIFFSIKKFLLIKNEESDDYKIFFNRTIEKDLNKEYVDIQNYMDLVFNGTKIDKDKIYYPSKNPKISIIIPVYNGEAFLKTAILSIQNQDFKDIEIIIVDDSSKDNSVNLIKEIMKTEPRIILYQNEENEGNLYTKTKGVMHSRGEYVMILDEDDMYVQREAFSSLYVEAVKNNLDMVGFVNKFSPKKIPRIRKVDLSKLRIITQPELSNLMYYFDSKGKVRQFGGSLTNIFVKGTLYKKVYKLIDEKNMNTHMYYHDDFIIYFLLTRNAKNIKFINRLFYVILQIWKQSNQQVKFRTEIKQHDITNKRCFAHINFLEILFKNTKNTIEDKKIAFSQVEEWYLNNFCRNNRDSKEKAIEVFKLYLDNEFVSNDDKKKIQNFING